MASDGPEVWTRQGFDDWWLGVCPGGEGHVLGAHHVRADCFQCIYELVHYYQQARREEWEDGRDQATREP